MGMGWLFRVRTGCLELLLDYGSGCRVVVAATGLSTLLLFLGATLVTMPATARPSFAIGFSQAVHGGAQLVSNDVQQIYDLSKPRRSTVAQDRVNVMVILKLSAPFRSDGAFQDFQFSSGRLDTSR